MENSIPKKTAFLTPCLPLEVLEKQEKKSESDYVTYTLKVRAGSAASAPTYKMKVAKFDNGTPGEWIDVIESFHEIWIQNSMTSAADKEASIKSILRDDSLTAFESSIEDSKEAAVQENPPISVAMIETALTDVSKNVFPHRALEIQKLWMRRAIRKPKDMTVRRLVAIISKMNKSLARFPGASEDDKFNSNELLEIIEWSLPNTWRAKFDLDRYVPSLFDKARLIAEAEAIERSEKVLVKQDKPKNADGKGTKTIQKKSHNPKTASSIEYYCSEHGKNKTHATANCYTIKNRNDGKTNPQVSTTTFSGKKFRKEINLMSKGRSKKKILDLYAAEINNQRALMTKARKKATIKKKAKIAELEDTTSEEDIGADMQLIEKNNEPPLKKTKRVLDVPDESDEEVAFRKKIKSLGRDEHSNATSSDGSSDEE